jgi:UDP-2,3-diacylglucosamine pyrophosphatase LpxH
MRYIKADVDVLADQITIFPIGDLHIGSPHFERKILDKQLKKIDETKNARIILMGDLAEVSTKTSVGAGVYEQDQNGQQQMMLAKSILYPYRELIDCIVGGNHEERIRKDSGFDLSLYFAQLMGLEDKYANYQGVVNYTLNQRSFYVSVWHGAGGGSTSGGAMNRLVKQSNTVLADIYLMGHVHQRQACSKQLYIPDARNNKIDLMQQYFIVTGSALTHENSYAEMAGFAPSNVGFPKIQLSVKRKMVNESNIRYKSVKVEI